MDEEKKEIDPCRLFPTESYLVALCRIGKVDYDWEHVRRTHPDWYERNRRAFASIEDLPDGTESITGTNEPS